MPMLLGKQIVLVGDHHQLPPVFRLNQDETTFLETEDEDDIKLKLNKFENLVTASYFGEMFSEANDSLKSRLTIQYRMHPIIMNSINHFYPPDYQLTCGIADPSEERRHPYIISGNCCELTQNDSHCVWVEYNPED